MALKCDECGYDNVDDALMCNMCQKIFRKEKKPSDGALSLATTFSDGQNGRPRNASSGGNDECAVWHVSRSAPQND